MEESWAEQEVPHFRTIQRSTIVSKQTDISHDSQIKLQHDNQNKTPIPQGFSHPHTFQISIPIPHLEIRNLAESPQASLQHSCAHVPMPHVPLLSSLIAQFLTRRYSLGYSHLPWGPKNKPSSLSGAQNKTPTSAQFPSETND